MKKLFVSFSIIALVAAFASCSKKSNGPSNNASVMFVHGCAAGATTVNLDGRANNVTVNGASNLAFLRSSGYQTIPSGTTDLSFFVTGLNVLTHQSENLVANTNYTAFAGGSITTPTFVFTTDDLTTPTSGNAKVRFVNLSPDNLTMSCYVGTVKIDSNVGPNTCTPFFEVANSTAKVSMIDQVTLSNSAGINTQLLTTGKIYTFIFTGSVTGSGTSVFTLSAINNN